MHWYNSDESKYSWRRRILTGCWSRSSVTTIRCSRPHAAWRMFDATCKLVVTTTAPSRAVRIWSDQTHRKIVLRIGGNTEGEQVLSVGGTRHGKHSHYFLNSTYFVRNSERQPNWERRFFSRSWRALYPKRAFIGASAPSRCTRNGFSLSTDAVFRLSKTWIVVPTYKRPNLLLTTAESIRGHSFARRHQYRPRFLISACFPSNTIILRDRSRP